VVGQVTGTIRRRGIKHIDLLALRVGQEEKKDDTLLRNFACHGRSYDKATENPPTSKKEQKTSAMGFKRRTKGTHALP
jgi:hypothetical protein